MPNLLKINYKRINSSDSMELVFFSRKCHFIFSKSLYQTPSIPTFTFQLMYSQIQPSFTRHRRIYQASNHLAMFSYVITAGHQSQMTFIRSGNQTRNSASVWQCIHKITQKMLKPKKLR